MGGGRVRAALACGAILALGAAGCGAEEHKNEPRPQAPTRVSVTVTDDAVTVQPPRIAFGPEPTQQIPQNQHTTQPPIQSKAPLSVVLVASNLTGTNSKLVLHGPRQVTSGALVANGNATTSAGLPTGEYTVTATGIHGASAGKLVVGPYRTSSENDILLP